MKKLSILILVVLALPTLAMADGYFGATPAYVDTGTAAFGPGNGYTFANRSATFTHVADGTETVDSIYIKLATANSGYWRGAVYEISATTIGALTGQGDSTSFTAPITHPAWYVAPCSIPLENGKTYTLAMWTNATIACTTGTVTGTRIIEADTSDRFDDPFNNWSDYPGPTPYYYLPLYAHYTTEEPSCTPPSNALTWIDSTTTSIRIRDVITGTFDSAQYFYDDDSTFAGSAYITVADNDSSTHRLWKTGLLSNEQYMFWAIAWNHLSTENCSDTDFVDTKTMYVPPSTKHVGVHY